ncbi:MAG: pirin family protein [Actinomycetota bacterium]
MSTADQTPTSAPGGSSTGTGARKVARIVASTSTLEGGGFPVNRPFPGPELDVLDPFLLLDEMAPVEVPPGEAVGAPAHPHRGFETVTYILQGEVEHRDSAGNHGIIGPGDVQWMTAGDGIIHSEMPSERVQTEGGVGHGLQLWVNLPAHLRRTAPSYQALTADRIPVARGDGWAAHVVAGSMLGVEGPARTHTPIGYARVTVQPGATVRIPAPEGHTAAVYAFTGRGELGPDRVRLEPNHLAVFEPSGGDLELTVGANAADALDCLVLTGEPIGEPIARYGPFVMNTKEEIAEAIDDFNAGRMGTIAATGTL